MAISSIIACYHFAIVVITISSINLKKAYTYLIPASVCVMIQLMTNDYFEINRLVEDLAKLYSTACATSWFKIMDNMHPTHEEFRGKVVEFMKHFEYTLASFPHTPAGEQFREQARKSLEKEIEKVLAGENKDVEKRYKYYVNYG
jgi:hypothetical protein